MSEKKSDIVFHFEKTRKQRAKIFINMGLMCWVYLAGIVLYNNLGQEPLPDSFKSISYWAFSCSSLLLFYIAYWHRKHPATYKAIVTKERLIVEYPKSEKWSFNVAIDDIKRFESRQSLSHAGSGVMQTGVLLKNGSFYSIPMNYGINLGDLHKAIQSVRPDIEFPSKVNKRVDGFISKDYDR